MKNKNGGFIATSLIYSFFLVFIAVIAALVSNYVANKTIMNRFNEDVMDELNTKSYTVTVYGKNANIQNGMTLTNLLTEGTFPSLTYWGRNGSCNYRTNIINEVSSSSLVMNNCNSNSYVNQKVYVLGGSTYYYTVSHYNPSTNVTMEFGNSISLPRTSEWIKTSHIYTSTYENNINFALGRNINSYYSEARFTNAMVLNLTASFGVGYEPDKNWIDKNIDYFEGTISFIRLEGINSKESATIRFNLYKDYMNDTNVKCYKESSNTEVAITKSSLQYDANGRPYKEVTINSVESNIRCNANWR